MSPCCVDKSTVVENCLAHRVLVRNDASLIKMLSTTRMDHHHNIPDFYHTDRP